MVSKIKKNLLILTLLIVTGLIVGQHWDGWNLQHKRDTEADWNFFISRMDQSSCAVNQGVFLVGCDTNGKLIPYNDSISTYDLGQAFFLHLRAAIRHKANRVTDAAQNTLILTLVGVFGVALALYCLTSINEFIFFLLLSLLYLLFYISPERHSMHSAVAMLAVMPALILTCSISRNWNWRHYAMAAILGGVLFFAAAITREAIALMGLISLLVVATVLLWQNPLRKYKYFAAISIISSLFLFKSQFWLIHFGGWLYDLPESKMIVGHGFSHNLFIGLGTVPNSLGIEWSDSYGEKIVQVNYPEILYLSKAYYSKIWEIYFQTVIENPMEVLRIYWEKFKLISLFHHHLLNLSILALGFGWFWLSSRRQIKRGSLSVDGFNPFFYICIICFTMIGMFFLQAVMVNFGEGYFRPTHLFYYLLLSLILGRFFRQGASV